MDYKKSSASSTTVTRNVTEISAKESNIYETIMVVSKRANQIGVEIKDELNKKLNEFASYTDNLEEIFENREQIEISKFYERMPKPALIALDEFLKDKIYVKKGK